MSFIFFNLTAIILVTACVGNKQVVDKAPDDQQILILPISGYSDISTFDPALSTDFAASTVINMLFTGLVRLDDQLQVQDDLAESHSVADDGVTWTFKLKPNLKFSDGTPLTSADVAYSIDRALSPELKSPNALAYLGLIKDSEKRYTGQIETLLNDSILTPDPQTVILIANKRSSYFLQALTYQTSYVVQKSMIDKYGNNFAEHLSEGIGGDGPFMVEKYVPREQVVFVPNLNFHGPKPQLRKVAMLIIQSTDTAYRAYQAGQLDQAPVPSQNLAEAMALPDGQFHQFPLLEVHFITMNYLTAPFDNIKIRQAFALAVNKDDIAHYVYRDTVFATNHIVPKGMPGYNPNLTGPLDVQGTNGDQDLARQLFHEGMQEEGLTLDTFPPITFSVSTRGSTDAINEYAALQDMWKNTLGVTVQIDDMERATLLGLRNASVNNPNGMQMWSLRWIADYPDPQDWLTLNFDKDSLKNGLNYGQNESSRATEQQANQLLMEQADINPDPISRMEQYNQAEQQLVNDVAWISTFQVMQTTVRKPCVVGIVDNAQGYILQYSWESIYISTATLCADISSYK
jgi:peptide/nickel transport system substrate-binding protein/oligopeptide transport system substrate-binding protein